MEKHHFYVFTGGPGSGKSTVLEVLAHMGFRTVEEVARGIIRREVATGGNAVPWGDKARYARLMWEGAVADYERLAGEDGATPCFFDRGIVDTVGYCRLEGLEVSGALRAAVDACRYNGTVFLFPFWQEIYRQDAERKQSVAEAERTFHALKNAYEAAGYATVEVPRLSPRERAEWVLESCRENRPENRPRRD